MSSSFLRVGGVRGRLHLRDLLVGVPEHLVKVRDGLEVLRLEVVVPEDVEVVLHQFGALFLDMDGAAAERRRPHWQRTSRGSCGTTPPRCAPAQGRRRRTAGRNGHWRWWSARANGSVETWDSFSPGSRGIHPNVSRSASKSPSRPGSCQTPESAPRNGARPLGGRRHVSPRVTPPVPPRVSSSG